MSTKAFLAYFGFDTLRDLPEMEALKDAGRLSKDMLLAGDIPFGLGGGEEPRTSTGTTEFD
ncbi:hypothetical protein [Ancylobacter novellus]|uniref:hypothetical protein n=1 Tax=Ancylobacter novellus TaxID=921 RepID=UPI0002EAD340